MKYYECSFCRRANSHLCNDCQDANFLLVNDTRKFYYINCEGDHHKGPVDAYLLPYKDVWPESYIWTRGMTGWDFAGNVLDRRTLAVNYNYCPCCNGEFEKHDVNLGYPTDDMEYVYKCKNCGFEFSYGATRMCSSAQMKYSRLYFKNKTDNTHFTFVSPINHNISTLKKGARIYLKNKLFVIIDSVLRIESAYILYYGIRIFMGKPNLPEKVTIAELFVRGKDKRADDGTRIITCKQCNYGQMELPFFKLIEDDYKIGIWQICECYGEEYGMDNRFIRANNTQYYVTLADHAF